MMEKQLPRQRLSCITMKNSPNPAKQMHKCLLKITVESRQKQNVKTSLGSTTLEFDRYKANVDEKTFEKVGKLHEMC